MSVRFFFAAGPRWAVRWALWWLLTAGFIVLASPPEILAQNQAGSSQVESGPATGQATGQAAGPATGPVTGLDGQADPTFTTTDLPPVTSQPEISPGAVQRPVTDAVGPAAEPEAPGAATSSATGQRTSGSESVSSPLGADSPSISIIKALGAFIAVIAVLLIFLKLLSYLTRGRKLGKGGHSFTLKGTMMLDSRRYLAAVEVGGHFLVIGVTPDRLTALANWPLAEEDPETGFFNTEDAVEGPQAFAPSGTVGRARSRRASAPATTPVAATTASVALALEKSEPEPAPAPVATPEPSSASNSTSGPAPGPGLGPGRGAGLGADPRTAAPEGPILDLSLDDAVFEGPDTNDDFLKMFEDDKEQK